MKKASRDGNRAGAGISIRFSVLLLAVSMLISTPAYSFATSAQDANGGSEPAVTEETNAPDDQNGQNSDQGSDQASGSQTDGTDRSGQSGSIDDQKGTDAANSGSEKTDPADTGNEKTDKASDDAGKTEEPVLKEQALSVSESDSYEITVSGKMPEDAVLDVREIVKENGFDNDAEKDGLPSYDELVENTASKIYEDDEFGEGDTLPYARFFDITITYGDGKEFEPEEALSVVIDMKDDVLKTKDVDFTAVHFDDESNAELVKVAIKDKEAKEKSGLKRLFKGKNKEENKEKVASFDAQRFSVYGVVYSYTVDFYYTAADAEKDAKPSEYHMNGGSEMMLSELFGKLGIERDTKDIKKVEFTDDSLVSFTKKGEDYRIRSLKPFTTGESLSVTFTDGEVIELKVEDAVTQYGSIPNSNGKAYYEFDSATGELRIRALNGATQTAYVNGNMANKNDWPWDNLRNQVKKVTFAKGTSGYGVGFSGTANNLFADMTNLTEVDFSGMDEIMATGIARMFSGCSSLETVDMSSVTTNGNLSNMQNMFRDCTSLKTVILNNQGFKTRSDNSKQGAQLANMFNGCSTLESVDMSNITLTGNNTTRRDLTNPFTGSSVKNINMDNVKFENVKSVEGFVSGLASLETISLENVGGASEIVSMRNMFANDPNLMSLDVRSFGKLEHIVNMDGFVSGCTSLETLNIDNLDNSRIKPTNSYHPAYGAGEDEGAAALDVDWSRELGIETCTALTTISAKKSRVWMTRNDRGLPGNEYWGAENENAIYYFTDQKFAFKSDEGPNITVATKRDYIDLMTDRHETGPRGNDDHTEDTTNKNMSGGHLNTNGAGFLAPGVYALKNGEWDKDEPLYQDTFYRICNFKESTPTAVVNNNNLKNNGSGRIDTVDMSYRSGEYTIKNSDDSPVILITYPAAAMDVNGKYHDVIVKVNRITFNNLDEIPSIPDPVRDHDRNYMQGKYLYDGQSYIRPVVQYGKGSLEFKNYIFNNETSRMTMMKGNAGTDIDFSIEIKDALPNTSVLFYMEDLDVPAAQDWIEDEDDACYDKLPWEYGKKSEVHYGEVRLGGDKTVRGEGIVLGDGNDLDTVAFAAHTGLQQEETYIHGTGPQHEKTYIHGTGPDPSTSWSSFSVKASADRADYTWTSGIGCTTAILRETDEPNDLSPVKLTPELVKTVNNTVPKGTFANEFFTFKLVDSQEVDSADYTYTYIDDGKGGLDDPESNYYNNENAPVEKKVKLKNIAGSYTDRAKNRSEAVSFNELKYASPKSTTFDDDNGIFGANVTNSPSGSAYNPDAPQNKVFEDNYYNEHIAQAYIYKISEVIPSPLDVDVLEYNTEKVTYFMKVIVSGPKSDLEMERGVRADVTVGRCYDNDTSKIYWDDYTRTVWSSDTTEKGQRLQENRFVEYPKGSTDAAHKRAVMVDRNGVEYIKVSGDTAGDTKYIDANNLDRVLLVTKEGDVYPYEEQSADYKARVKHDDKILSKYLEVEGQQVMTDVHGKSYIKEGGKYYSVNTETGTKGGELELADGVFNPDTDNDLRVSTDWKVNGAQVKQDVNHRKYFKAADGKYRDPENHSKVLTVGTVGDVTPSDSDEHATRDSAADAPLHITVGDKSYSVREDHNGNLYYIDGSNYYSIVGTMLTPGRGGFEPNHSDELYVAPFDIMQDGDKDNTLYYKSHGKYYRLSDSSDYTPSGSATVDRRIVRIGKFNNNVRTSNIVIGKNTEGDKTGTFTYRISFDNGFVPTEYQFAPSAPTVFRKATDGSYEFTLQGDQQVTIYDVPFQTTYTLEEPLSGDVNCNGWEFVMLKNCKPYDRDSHATPSEYEESAHSSVSRTIVNENQDFYTHVFTNRFTELTADKTITVKEGGTPDASAVFKYSAKITVSGIGANSPFTYGYMKKDSEHRFYAGTAGDTGSAEVSMSFTLKHGETVDIVVPKGATVAVTEEENSYIPSTKVDKEGAAGQITDSDTATAKNVSDSDKYKLHFYNQEVSPVNYSDVTVEKVIRDHAWMSGYKFEMALIPVGYFKDGKVEQVGEYTPIPEDKKKEFGPGEGVYLPKFIDNNSTEIPEDELAENEVGRRGNFDAITFTNEDMKVKDKNGKWKQTDKKTFVYYIRELSPQEGSDNPERAPGLSYSDERYEVDIEVELVRQEAALRLVVGRQKIYKLTENNDGSYTRTEVQKARFNNVFDPNKSFYRMAADKFLTSNNSKDLENGAYSFTLRPAGEKAGIAPMPKDTKGEGKERYLTVSNVFHMVRFLDHTADEDGLSFKYEDLTKPTDQGGQGLTNDELLAGVVFDYEMNEEIPEGAVNNYDGTWTVTHENGDMTVYDGIYHIRSIKVKLKEDESGTIIIGDKKYIISVTNDNNDATRDKYIGRDGEKHPASELGERFNAEEHHTMGGAPIFHNFYVAQETAKLTVNKLWDDYDNQDDIRPENVTVTVKSDEGYSKEFTIGSEGSVTTEDLPVYSHNFDEGKPVKISYTVTEKQEGVITGNEKTGYKPTYDKESVTLDQEAEKNAEITVTNTHKPTPGEATGAETWGLRGETQKGHPHFHHVITNPVKPYKLEATGIKDAVENTDGSITIPNIGTYRPHFEGINEYVTFEPEGDYTGNPPAITILGYDRQENPVRVKYQPHVVYEEEE
ncbi:MAG: Cna B-type domain-containing protein, partial [Clostridiales bacterium]|nr:Cna B-type domain-containing protein [Clostridiales bacterium]